MVKYDNIIIGGGISGLICGGYLAKAGQKTMIIESRGKTGGRIYSPIDKFEGYSANIHGFTHHPTMGNGGWWAGAAKELGAKIRIRFVSPTVALWERGKGFAFHYKRSHSSLDGMLDLADLQAPKPLSEASKRELKKILKEILDWDLSKMCLDLDTVFLRDWLNERTENPEVHHFFYNVLCQMICTDIEDGKKHFGAGKCFTLYRQWLGREGEVGIAQDGTLYDNFVKPFEEAYLSFGGELKLNATVNKVIVSLYI